jgi:hypothetical protein
MLCQVCIPEIIAQDLARHQEVCTIFFIDILIERPLLSIAGMILLGYIMPSYRMCILPEFSSTAQTKRTIYMSIPIFKVSTAFTCVAPVHIIFVLRKSWGCCFKILYTLSHTCAAAWLGLGICSTIRRTRCTSLYILLVSIVNGRVR